MSIFIFLNLKGNDLDNHPSWLFSITKVLFEIARVARAGFSVFFFLRTNGTPSLYLRLYEYFR